MGNHDPLDHASLATSFSPSFTVFFIYWAFFSGQTPQDKAPTCKLMAETSQTRKQGSSKLNSTKTESAATVQAMVSGARAKPFRIRKVSIKSGE